MYEACKQSTEQRQAKDGFLQPGTKVTVFKYRTDKRTKRQSCLVADHDDSTVGWVCREAGTKLLQPMTDVSPTDTTPSQPENVQGWCPVSSPWRFPNFQMDDIAQD
eukprot:COSAG05_NODE_17967_length_316_cov_0.718894_1_plen_105_part_11